MKRLVYIVCALLLGNAFAVDHIWDMRYTFGPESKPSPKFSIGIGGVSNYGKSVFIPANMTASISKEWNIGGKVDVQGVNSFDEVKVSMDIGGRYIINENSFVELDGYFGLNRNNSTAAVLSYGYEQFISKNFANFHEVRIGILDGVAGEDGIAKLSFSTTPTLYFNDFFRTFIEICMSGSVGNVKDDFMIDIIPKFEFQFRRTTLSIDFDIGIMQEKNNDGGFIAIFLSSAF